MLMIIATSAHGAERMSSPFVKSLLEMRRSKVVIQEWDLSCGAAALATVLRYQYGEPVTEKEVAKALINREEYLKNPKLVQIRQGFSLLDLKRYVESRGYKGIGYGKLSVGDLLEMAPITVPIETLGYNHFVVFRGAMEDRVLLSDPAWGNRTMTVDDFERAWINYGREIGRVGFVVALPDGTTRVGELAPTPEEFVVLN
jgi:predicted double-glycine peptidase